MPEPSTQQRIDLRSAGLTAIGAMICCAVAIAYAASLGPAIWFIFLGAGVSLAGAALFQRTISSEQLELEALRTDLTLRESSLTEETAAFEKLRATVNAEFERDSISIENRRRDLAERLTVFHEWGEFPAPLNLADGSDQSRLPADPVDRDRELQTLLENETKILFEHIKSNRYSREGKLQWEPLRDDLQSLILKTAKIYRPQAEQPLLETNLETLIRGLSRVCLQFLTVLEELPLDVKQYDLTTLYAAVRRSVAAYETYKSVEPYWKYANTAYYAGRLALGASPLTLGAWWFLGALGKEAAKNVTARIVNRHALALLSATVRVIGYETAAAYDPDFRARDPNWIYGTELTQLLASFPASRESLRHSLREIGSLQLRSEYDRVFLTRCAANGTGAQPERYRAAEVLTLTERRAVAERLEHFAAAFLHGKNRARVEAWQQGAEKRLDLKIRLDESIGRATREEQLLAAWYGLAAFAVRRRECESDRAAELLAATRTAAQMGAAVPDWNEETLGRIWEVEDHPDLDPAGEFAALYLEDLAAIAAATSPRNAETLDQLREAGLYLRCESKSIDRLWEKQIAVLFEKRLQSDAPIRKLPHNAMCAVLDLAGSQELSFVYDNIKSSAWSGKIPRFLLGTPSRLAVFELRPEPILLWTTESPPELKTTRGIVSAELSLTAAECRESSGIMTDISLVSPILGRSDAYFRAISAWTLSRQGTKTD